MEHDRKHLEYVMEIKEMAHDLHNITRKLKAKRGPGIEHVPWDVWSHYTFLPPKERKDKVSENYKLSLPSDLREEFQKEFEKSEEGKCAKKKRF